MNIDTENFDDLNDDELKTILSIIRKSVELLLPLYKTDKTYNADLAKALTQLRQLYWQGWISNNDNNKKLRNLKSIVSAGWSSDKMSDALSYAFQVSDHPATLDEYPYDYETEDFAPWSIEEFSNKFDFI